MTGGRTLRRRGNGIEWALARFLQAHDFAAGCDADHNEPPAVWGLSLAAEFAKRATGNG